LDIGETLITISGILASLTMVFKFETKRICKEIENLKSQVDEIHKKVFHK